MSGSLDVAVVGVGYLGTLHAEKYAVHPRARLRALVDPDPRARAVARRLGVPLYTDLSQLPPEVRAASVAVPTALHHGVAGELLRAGRDVLIEKPIAASPAEADDLIAVADAGGRVLMVGHLERFNPALLKLADLLRGARFIESHRLAPFNLRGSDVDVVRDLMIHDIDIILSLVRCAPVSIRAAGVAVVSDSVDIANARLEFEDGCIANVTASRVSAEKLRKIRVFQPEAYVSIDFLRRSAAIIRRRSGGRKGARSRVCVGRNEADGTVPDERLDRARAAPPSSGVDGERPPSLADLIVREEIAFDSDESGDALALEIEAFLAAVAGRTEPPVTGRDGRNALEVAERIVQQIEERAYTSVTASPSRTGGTPDRDPARTGDGASARSRRRAR